MNYAVPTMREIARKKPNGLNVISTFSGCGGSSLGLKMAGFRVRWASEFIPAAADTYELNHPGTPVDRRDIRVVTADEILEASGLRRDEVDVLEGSPPCAAFSLAGSREKSWGRVKSYSDGSQRVDDLFFEFIRLLGALQPRAFVAENVPGLVVGKARGYYNMILESMRSCGYNVRSKILDSSWLGVPQARERLIFIGVRNDVGCDPIFPNPIPGRVTLRQALEGLSGPGLMKPIPDDSKSLRYYRAAAPGQSFDVGISRRTGKRASSWFSHIRLAWDRPTPTACATTATLYHPDEPRYLGIDELRRVSSFPDDFKLEGPFMKQWERLGRSVPPMMMRSIGECLEEVLS